MYTFRFAARHLVVGALAAVLATVFVLGTASTADAQVPEGPGDLLDPDTLPPEIQDLVGELNLEELLSLLELLEEDPGPQPAPPPETAVPPPTPAATPVAQAPAAPQVTQRPVGGVATGAGGAAPTSGAPSLSLLLAGAVTLTGAGTAVSRAHAGAA